MLLGGWLIGSQFVLDYSTITDVTLLIWYDVLTGAAVAFFALWSAIATVGRPSVD